jgi:hypothetical protein
LSEPAVDDGFFHLELWNPEAKEPSGLLGSLEHHDTMSRSNQLLSCGKAGRP